LNTPGGIVDLRTGKIMDHDRSLGMTKIATATPVGDCPAWHEFLATVTNNDAQLQAYLRRVAGYCLTGRYDWQRLIHTTAAVPATEEGGPRIGVMEGGWHAAEGLIIARYFMFTQVYFHKTRVVFDHPLQEALSEMLPGQCFPKPVAEDLDQYLGWDDWRVLGLLADGKGGEQGARLARRDHYREIIHTPETPTADDLERLGTWRAALGDLLAVAIPAEKSWYKTGPADVQFLTDWPKSEVKPLSTYSSVVENIQPVRQVRLYARLEHRDDARARLKDI
jgi:hypothetical protein